MQIRSFQARLDVARRQETVERDLVALLTRRRDEGVAPDRDLHAAKAELERVRALIPPLALGLETQLNRLDVLMGAQPGAERPALAAPVPEAPALAARFSPADLLRRRPDVRAAEERLISTNAAIGVAIADYYPKVSLQGLLGGDALQPGRLFTGGAQQGAASAGLTWRLFDFGRIDAEVARARGRYAEALAAYRAAVYRAAEDVENALAETAQERALALTLDRRVSELALGRRQAESAYEGGVTSLFEVRTADRDLLEASDALIQARCRSARAAIATVRAFGGGSIDSAPASSR